MTRSVEELRRESERNRVQLAATVERLKGQISDTTEDIRHKVSPEHIKTEISGYISNKTESWLGALKQQAMDNPMQAVAAGLAVGFPLLRVARSVPLPLLMIGAGLALSSKSVRERATEAAAPAFDKAKDIIANASADAHAKSESLSGAAAVAAGDLQSSVSGSASSVVESVGQALDDASKQARDGVDKARQAVVDVASSGKAAVEDNALLIGGIGVAIGAIIAASLPRSRVENSLLGSASNKVTDTASSAVATGLGTAKDAVASAADAAAQQVKDADLGEHVGRIADDVVERLKDIADDAVTTALDPSKPSHQKRESHEQH